MLFIQTLKNTLYERAMETKVNKIKLKYISIAET